MIICIHVPFPGMIGTMMTPLSRIAVPLFFMITGYYYSFTKERKHEKKQLNKIIRLFAGANLLYFVWDLLKAFLVGNSVTTELNKMLSVKSLLKFILFSDSPFGEHLWYLGAILYVLLIIMFFEKKWSRENLYPVVPLLLLADLVFGKYSLLLFDRTVPYILVRNFLCVGLPYFLIGDWIYTRNIKIKPDTAKLLIVVFICTTLAERFMLEAFSVNAERDHYLSTTFLAVFVFLLAVQHEEKYTSNGISLLCNIGAKLSTNIYILHPIVITVTAKIVVYGSCYVSPLGVWYSYMAPFVIFILTATASWMLIEITKKPRHT